MHDVEIIEMENGGKRVEIRGHHTSVQVEVFKLMEVTAFRVALIIEGKETAIIAALDDGELPALLRGIKGIEMPKIPKADA